MPTLTGASDLIGRIKNEMDKCRFNYLSYAFSDKKFCVYYNTRNDVAHDSYYLKSGLIARWFKSELIATKCLFAKYSITLYPISTTKRQEGMSDYEFKLVESPTVFYDSINDEYFNETNLKNNFLQSIIIYKENDYNLQLFYKSNYTYKDRAFDNVDLIELLRKRQLVVLDKIKTEEGEDVVFNQYRSYLVNPLRQNREYNEIWGRLRLKYFRTNTTESFIKGLSHCKSDKFCQKSSTIFDLTQHVFDDENFKFSLDERDFGKYRLWVEQLNRVEIDVTSEWHIIRFYGAFWKLPREQKDNLLFGLYYNTNEGIAFSYERLGHLFGKLWLFEGIFHLKDKHIFLSEPPDTFHFPNVIDLIIKTVRVTEVGYSNPGKDNTFVTYCYFDLDKLTLKPQSVEYIFNFIWWLGNEHYHYGAQKENKIGIRITIDRSHAYSPSFQEKEIDSTSLKAAMSKLFKKHFNTSEFCLLDRGILIQ